MNTRRMLPVLVLAAAVAASGADCPTIPKLEDRIVELVTSGSLVLPWQAEGSINTYTETKTINFATDFDIAGAVDDAGIDLDDVISIKLSGASYRVTVPDPNPNRSISNTTVTVQREGGSVTPLLTSFGTSVNSVTSFTTAALDPAGVAVLNGLLADMLTSLKNGTPLANPNVTYTVNGTCNPTDQATSFSWESKLDVNIKGTVEIEVLN